MKRKLNTAEIEHLVSKFNKTQSYYPLDTQTFNDHAERYIKACREYGLICNIESVSRSGMSRTLCFYQMSKGKDHNGKPRYYVSQFWTLFKILGFRESKGGNFVISGCGMDMVFATNYDIVHKLYNLGFIGSKECDVLAQRTPQVI